MREIAFRTRYGLNVVGLKRDGVALADRWPDEPFADGRYHSGFRGELEVNQILLAKGRDFVALNMPWSRSKKPPAHSRAPHAIFASY